MESCAIPLYRMYLEKALVPLTSAISNHSEAFDALYNNCIIIDYCNSYRIRYFESTISDILGWFEYCQRRIIFIVMNLLFQ